MSPQVYELVLNLFIVVVCCSCLLEAVDNVWWD